MRYAVMSFLLCTASGRGWMLIVPMEEDMTRVIRIH